MGFGFGWAAAESTFKAKKFFFVYRNSNKPNTSVSVTQTDSDADLNKAIELSIQQQKTDVGVTTEDIHPFDETVIDSSLDYYRFVYKFLP